MVLYSLENLKSYIRCYVLVSIILNDRISEKEMRGIFMVSSMNNLYVLENKNQILIYSLDTQSWMRGDKNYIQSLSLDEMYELLEKFHLKSKQEQGNLNRPKIHSLYIFITRKCNMNCSFCSMDAGPHVNTNNEMTLEETIDFLKYMNRYRIDRIIISGGEPLLSPKLYSILEYISKKMKNTQIVVQTNGALINENFCNRVKDKVTRLNISIESIYDIWSNKKNEFIEQLEIVYRNNIQMEFSFVVTKENSQYVYDYIELCRHFNAEAGIKIVSAVGGEKRFDELSLNEEEILEFYKEICGYILEHNYIENQNLETILGYVPIPRNGCSAFYLKSISLLPDGNVCRCHSIKEGYFNDIGNIRTENAYSKIEDKITKNNSEELFSVSSKIYCRTCVYKHFCTGICCAEIYNCPENTFYKPASCEWKKILISYYLWNHDKQNRKSMWEEIYKVLEKRLDEKYE